MPLRVAPNTREPAAALCLAEDTATGDGPSMGQGSVVMWTWERPVVIDRRLAGRWARAGVVAVAVALWPLACSQDQLSKESGAANEPAKLGFVLKDMSGKDVRLADFKGRPMIINFWATWCPPC